MVLYLELLHRYENNFHKFFPNCISKRNIYLCIFPKNEQIHFEDMPPPKKKQVDDPGVGLSPDTKEATAKEENRTPEKKPRSGGKRLRGKPTEEILRWDQRDVVKKLLKDCGLSAEFKVMGSSKCGPTVGCLACMKKRAMASTVTLGEAMKNPPPHSP